MTYPKLKSHFLAAQRLVAEKRPEMASIKLQVGCPDIETRRQHGDQRSYMHVGHHKNTICVHEDAEDLDASHLWGLFLHEFGHLLVGPENGEGEANLAINKAFGISILYDENMLQFVEGL